MFSVKWFAIFLFFSPLTFSMELDEGFSRNAENGSLFKTINQKYGTRPGYLYEYSEDKYYSLSKNASAIGDYELNSSSNTIKGWPLARWQYEPIENEVKSFQADIYKKLYQKVFNPIGCLDEIPLNQGDLDADGKSELILFLGYDLVVFSPEAGRIVFMINYTVPGWMSLEGTAHHHEANWIKEGDEGVPQYQNLLDEHYGDALAGLRGYAKLYVGDFDKNGQTDILVWRKLYESNMQNNPVKGFHKLKDSFYHYERSTAAGSTGEYLPQETDPGTIQSWLAEKNLTWQSGYPSQSECEGEEGQLIPEMHDPLLNDPDVLH